MTQRRPTSPLLSTGVMRRAALHGLPKTRASISPPRPLAGAAMRAAKPSYQKFRRHHNELEAVWGEIVGPTLAQMTRPEHYRPGTGLSNNGQLTVRVDGALALNLQHMSPQIVERVNAYFGYQAIARLKIVQGPVLKQGSARPVRHRPLSTAEREDLERSVEPVQDAGLKAALIRLGRKVLGRD